MVYFFNKYEYGRVLGEGGSGKVFAACRKEDGLPVAIKRVKIHNGIEFIDDESEDLFIPFEIFVMKRLRGVPGVVKLIDYCVSRKFYFLVMERVGVDLFDMLEKYPDYFNENTCKTIVKNLVDTALMCKRKGFVHNDIKLENVAVDMITGRAKLFDYGNSDFFCSGFINRFKGTKFLYPPEWVKFSRHKLEYTAVWTIGVVLYELVHGFFPFEDDQKILDEQINCTSTHPRIRDFIFRCLSHYDRWDLEQMQNHPWLKD